MSPIRRLILRALVDLGGSATVDDIKARTNLATLVINPHLRGILATRTPRPLLRAESEERDLRIGSITRLQRQTVWYITDAGRAAVREAVTA